MCSLIVIEFIFSRDHWLKFFQIIPERLGSPNRQTYSCTHLSCSCFLNKLIPNVLSKNYISEMQQLGKHLAIFIRIICLRFKGCWWRFGRADWWVVIKLTNDEDYEFLRHLIINRTRCILTKTTNDRSEKRKN